MEFVSDAVKLVGSDWIIDHGDHAMLQKEWSRSDPPAARIHNSWIEGGRGNDIIMAGQGRDEITGGAGDDFIDGGSESDSVNAEAQARSSSGKSRSRYGSFWSLFSLSGYFRFYCKMGLGWKSVYAVLF